jgi:hypothetical protein
MSSHWHSAPGSEASAVSPSPGAASRNVRRLDDVPRRAQEVDLRVSWFFAGRERRQKPQNWPTGRPAVWRSVAPGREERPTTTAVEEPLLSLDVGQTVVRMAACTWATAATRWSARLTTPM